MARQFDAPKFSPHLTLGLAQDRYVARSVLRNLKASPIRLRILGISASSRFTRTLFVRCKSNGALEQLLVDLAGKAKPLRDPHISLLYKQVPARVKKELVSVIKLPFREIAFDSVKVVRCSSPTLTRADIESWRALATRKLSG